MRLTLFILILLTGCQSDKDWQPIRVKEGKHQFRPNPLSWNYTRIDINEWRFTESCEYDLQDSDQCDWNKLTGYSPNFFTNHENSIMASWRYDKGGYFWVAPYVHKSGLTFWSNAPCTGFSWGNNDVLKAIKVRTNETFTTILRLDPRHMTVLIKNNVTGKETSHTLELGDYEKVRDISTWFGGNESAPNDMIIMKRQIHKR